jgi:hypothetical protein
MLMKQFPEINPLSGVLQPLGLKGSNQLTGAAILG